MTQSYKKQVFISKSIIYLFLILGAVIMIFPFLWMILTSFKTQAEAMAVPPKFFPSSWKATNFERVTKSLPFTNLFMNTGLMIVFRIVCAVAFSSMAGFAFAKINFRGKTVLFSLVLVQMMLPSQIFIIPQYQMLAKFGLTNSIFALVFPGLVSAFGTFFLRQTYLGIPNEIAESAYIEGCNKWTTFTKVMFPLTTNSVAAISIFTDRKSVV